MQLFSDTMDETSIQNTIDAYRLFRGLGLHYGFDSYAVVDLRSIGSEFRYKQAVVLHALAEVELDMVDAQASGGEDDPLIAGLASSMAPFMLAADEDGEGECPIFCVSVIWFMLPERSNDDDDFQGTAGRTSKGLRAA